MTSSPLLFTASTGQPGSASATGAGAGAASVSHAYSGDACQLHHDSPPAPYDAHTWRKRCSSAGAGDWYVWPSGAIGAPYRRLCANVFPLPAPPDPPIPFQYTCGRFAWAAPGARNTEYGSRGWKSTYGNVVRPTGYDGPIVARRAAMYCWACAYLPWYADSASMTRQSAPAATARAPWAASPAGSLP